MKITKKQRKLLKGGNASVKRSIQSKSNIGEYVGITPKFFNKASLGQLPNFIKISNGIPFVRPSLHGFL